LDALTTFTDRREFERAAALLNRLSIEHTSIVPEPAYEHVGCPAIALTAEGKAQFLEAGGSDCLSAGWVDYRAPAQGVPDEAPREFAEDIVGRVAIVVLAPCVADFKRLRLTAHLSGDVAEALPYLNAEMPQGSYTAKLPVFTSMDGHRMVSLFRDRIAVAKAAPQTRLPAAVQPVNYRRYQQNRTQREGWRRRREDRRRPSSTPSPARGRSTRG
jgi:hypothetical protein